MCWTFYCRHEPLSYKDVIECLLRSGLGRFIAMPHEKPLEEIVSEVGKYALEAYVFVQDCIGEAAQRVHGPMPQAGVTVATWMARKHVDPAELVYRYEIEDCP